MQRTLLLAAALCITTAHGQGPSTVPFIGCKSDGQLGPQPAPRKPSRTIRIEPAAASRLAFYQGFDGPSVLAPRGWFCFETYGSNGSTLYVSPTPFNPKQFFDPSWKGFQGPVIQLSSLVGDTSGRFEVAQIIARVFPAHRDFVEKVIAEGLTPASDYPFGPYPNDRLTYKSKELVEYTTPPARQGLGTASRLLPNHQPIVGFAMLVGDDPDLLHLALRLPDSLHDLIPIILRQAEQPEP